MTVEGDTPAARATSARVAAIGSSGGDIQPAGAVGWYDDGARSLHGIRCSRPVSLAPAPGGDEGPAGPLDRHRLLGGVEDDRGNAIAQVQDPGLAVQPLH